MKKQLYVFGFLCLVMLGIGKNAVAEENPSVRDGQPCLKEVCVGDDALSLKGIRWETVVGLFDKKPVRNKKPDQWVIDKLNGALRGEKASMVRLAPYWGRGWKVDIDAYALQQLRGIRAFCEPVTFSLSYRSESGYLTSLLVETVPTESLEEHKLVVNRIVREYPRELSELQYKQLDEEIKNKYQAVIDRAQSESNSPIVDLGFSPSGAPALTLSIGTPSNLFRNRNDLVKMHPECEGEKLIKID